MSRHVFISYSRQDIDFVTRLENGLNTYGIKTWRDQGSIQGGADWEQAIQQGLEQAYAVISVVTPSANQSRWVKRETLYADNRGIPLYPVLPEQGELPFSMQEKNPLLMSRDHYEVALSQLVQLLTSTNTPIKASHGMFSPGTFLGKIKLQELEYALPHAWIYSAEVENEIVFCKIAKPTFEDHLRREVSALGCLQNNLHNTNMPGIPRLLPARHIGGNDPWVKIAPQLDQQFSFILLEPFEARLLRDVLIKNPQPYHEHVAWFIIRLIEIIETLHDHCGFLHLNLKPEVIGVQERTDGVLQPILLDWGLGIPIDSLKSSWHVETESSVLDWRILPPELGKIDYVDPDVHIISLLLYEMLAGQPAFEFGTMNEDEIKYVKDYFTPPNLERNDLFPRLIQFVNSTINSSNSRGLDLHRYRESLVDIYGSPKLESKSLLRELFTRLRRNSR